MRDRDANTAWATASADGVLEERRVYCQNWRGDVSAVITDTGKMVEWVKYSAYGVAMGLPCGDTDSNCTWDATDAGAIGGSLDPRDDADLNGALNAADVIHANSITGGYQTLGRTVMTSASVANRKGYAGYENDGSVADQYHVRYRVYRPMIGRWIKRDPVGYLGGMGLYEYTRGTPLISTDPTGLVPSYPTPTQFIPYRHYISPHERFKWEEHAEWGLRKASGKCPRGEASWIVQHVIWLGATRDCGDMSELRDWTKDPGSFWEAFEVPAGSNRPMKDGTEVSDEFVIGESRRSQSGKLGVEVWGRAVTICLSDTMTGNPDDNPFNWGFDKHTGLARRRDVEPSWWKSADATEPPNAHSLFVRWNTCHESTWEVAGEAWPAPKRQRLCMAGELVLFGYSCGD